MNTKNTKTAVIILLIIANIFFIYNRISLKISSENISAETIEDAVNVLARNGFIVDRNKIPAKKPANLIYEGKYAKDIYRENIVKSFSGVSSEEIKEAGDMFGPLGTSYTAGDYKFMFPEKKMKTDYFEINITDRNYQAPEENFENPEEETEKTRIDTEFPADKKIDGIARGDIKKAEKAIKNFIKKYQNQDRKLGFEIIGLKEDGHKNCERVLINQTVDGALIDSHIAYIEIQDGKVKYFSGAWYFGELTAKSEPLLDSVNILFKCLDTDKGIAQSETLVEMNPEYSVVRHAEGFYLAPSWQLVFESGKKLSYDMITGGKKIKD